MISECISKVHFAAAVSSTYTQTTREADQNNNKLSVHSTFSPDTMKILPRFEENVGILQKRDLPMSFYQVPTLSMAK
jgi:hypothetical protein